VSHRELASISKTAAGDSEQLSEPGILGVPSLLLLGESASGRMSITVYQMSVKSQSLRLERGGKDRMLVYAKKKGTTLEKPVLQQENGLGDYRGGPVIIIVLVKDPGSGPSTHMVFDNSICNSNSRGPNTLF